MNSPAPRRGGCLRLLFRGALILVALFLGGLGWDVWQLRSLRPPQDSSFEGFLSDGRKGALMIDAAADRLYWVAPPARTIVRSSEPPVYEFNRAGALVNWTPGNEKGMILDAPIRRRGTPATVDEARAWLRRR